MKLIWSALVRTLITLTPSFELCEVLLWGHERVTIETLV